MVNVTLYENDLKLDKRIVISNENAMNIIYNNNLEAVIPEAELTMDTCESLGIEQKIMEVFNSENIQQATTNALQKIETNSQMVVRHNAHQICDSYMLCSSIKKEPQ